MARQIRAEGQLYSFPDDATDQEISEHLSQMHPQENSSQNAINPPSEREERLNKMKSILSNSPSGYLDQGRKEFSGGLLNSLVGMAKAGLNMTALPSAVKGAQSLLPEALKQKLESAESFDPYKAMGTEEKRFYTPGGAVQLAGELFTPGSEVAKSIPAIKKSLPTLAEKLMPGKAAERVKEEVSNLSKGLSEHLGQGSKTTEEVAPEIANDVRKLHDAREANAGIYFDHVLNQVNNTADKGLLYKKADPLISTALDEGKDLMGQIKDLKVGDLYKKFEESPTFQNAHNLQQELGLMIGDLKKIPGKSADERLQLSSIKSARDKLKSDMNGYLEDKYPNKNENLAPTWKKGIDLYREEVAPLLANKKLREINRGRKNYVKNIHTAFENPESADEVLRTGEKIKGSGSKVLDMLPESTKNKILFSKIGAHSGEDTNKFVSAIDSANRKGYSKYLSPSLQEGLSNILGKQQEIDNHLANKKFNKKLMSVLGVGAVPTIAAEEYMRRR